MDKSSNSVRDIIKITISGNVGIGKTRIALDLYQYLHDQGIEVELDNGLQQEMRMTSLEDEISAFPLPEVLIEEKVMVRPRVIDI